MEILVFLCVISHLSLVLADDNVAIDPVVTHKSTYKVHPDPKDVDTENDQMADSSHPVSQTYGHALLDGKGALAQLAHDGHSFHEGAQQHEDQVQDGLRHTVEALQPVLSEGYAQQPQQIYVHHYPMQPIRILDAEASPLRQVQKNENQGTIGYSSYVEHVSHKDEEEINSALREGSVDDIKRLVPKSEMSFKIYNNEKKINQDVENQKVEVQPSVTATQMPPKISAGYSQQSKFHHRVRTEAPATQFKTTYQIQPPVVLEGPQQTYIKTGEQQNGYENSKQLLQSLGKTSHRHDHQSVNSQAVYYTQPEVNSQKAYLDILGKSSSVVKPHHKSNTDISNYRKTTSTAELNSISTSRGSKPRTANINNLHYQKQWSFDSKTEDSQKSVTNVKPIAVLQYEIEPIAHSEGIRGLPYTPTYVETVNTAGQAGQSNVNKQKTNSLPEKNIKSVANTAPTSYVSRGPQGKYAGHLGLKTQTDQNTAQNVLNKLSVNYVNTESLKTGQSHIVSHLGTTAYAGSQPIKASEAEHFAIQAYSDNESEKSEHDASSHVAQNPYVETNTGQNNFDHQKALEGSTMFDIKNAIDSTGSLIYQTNYVSPTTEVHSLDDLQKQQIAYIIPKIKTQAVLVNDGNHENSAVEGHQVKDFGHGGISTPQLSYQAVSDVSGKFYHQPQTIVWTTEHLKHGNTLTANDLQNSIVKLHMPKQEVYQHSKTPNIQLPTSSISHIMYPNQKQPQAIHYYPQEVHYQPKTKSRIQTHSGGHMKLTQPVTIDWSLYRSALPNIQTISMKPELTTHLQETGKKIVPIIVRKRKNRSNSNQEIGVVYGRVNSNRRPLIPNHRQERTIRANILQEASNNVPHFETRGERKNEFAVSASYKVDRSFKSPNSS